MKKKLLIALGFLVVVHVILMMMDKTYVYKAVYYNYADIDDASIFDNRTIKASSKPQPWKEHKQLGKYAPSAELISKLEELQSIAFLMIKNDAVMYEQYWDIGGVESQTNSFSMAKSHVAAMIGITMKEGKIKSLDQPVGDFVASFAEGDKARITIRHLLTMTSGTNWDESYSSPFSMTTEAYYGSDLQGLIDRLEAEKEPGIEHYYKSGDSQLLSFVLREATGKSPSEYLQEKIYEPLGYERDATWSLDDENGLEKAYCCINSNARDFARMGKLYMNKGKWNGKEIIPKEYVEQSLAPVKLEDGTEVDFYGYQWWLLPDYPEEEIFYMRGILGQFVICLPKRDIIIVRLGHQRGERVDNSFEEVYMMIDEALKIQ